MHYKEYQVNTKAVVLGALAYTLVTFPLAVTWHVLLFEEKYHSFGYFKGEPSFALGLLTILIQGLILSFLYQHVRFAGTNIVQGLKYSMLIGLFFWTSHVLAFVAKQTINEASMFIAMESLYLLFQFGIYGVLISKIYSKENGINA
jgi:hypothetical protein